MQGIKGIDVSRYQGDIDWRAVAGDGVKFAMIKALQGSGSVDRRFLQNARGAEEAGIPFGVYVYSKAADAAQARAEARAAIELTQGFTLQYPVAIDVESAHFREMESSLLAGIINAFCKEIEGAGLVPLVYSNKDWLMNVIPEDVSCRWDVWLAQWRKSDPDYPGPFTMWQYGRGEVKGIDTMVDMDICLVDYAEVSEAARPLVFRVETPYLRGDAYMKMQLALIAANYTDSNGDPLDPDGVWGPKSQQALDKLIKAQGKQT